MSFEADLRRAYSAMRARIATAGVQATLLHVGAEQSRRLATCVLASTWSNEASRTSLRWHTGAPPRRLIR